MSMRPLLITAGATRNPIDAMRYLSAFSSGGTGVWLAGQLAAAGAEVHLLGNPEAVLRAPAGVTTEVFSSTRDLLARMRAWVQAHPGGVVVHAAAVGDYEAVEIAGKIPSGQPEIVLRLRPTPKIVDLLLGWDPTLTLVSFKAAPPETDLPTLEQIASAQRARTGSALVFANTLGRLDCDVLLVGADQTHIFATRSQALDALLAWLCEKASLRGA